MTRTEEQNKIQQIIVNAMVPYYHAPLSMREKFEKISVVVNNELSDYEIYWEKWRDVSLTCHVLDIGLHVAVQMVNPNLIYPEFYLDDTIGILDDN